MEVRRFFVGACYNLRNPAKETHTITMTVHNRKSQAAHRINYALLTVLQVILDIALYQFCFSFKFPIEIKIFLTGTMTACFLFGRLYGFRNWSLWDEIGSVLRASVLMLLVDALYIYANRFTVSFISVLVGILLFIPATLAMRYFFRRGFFRLGWLSKSVIILGAGEAGKTFAQKITSSPFTIRRALCFIDDDDSKRGSVIEGVPVKGRVSDFKDIQQELHADEAVIAIPTASRQELAGILHMLEDSVKRVLYLPDMYMLTTSVAEIRSIDGMPIISSSQGLLNPVNIAVKTIIDYIGAVIALVIFSPLMIWAAYRIKKEDGGPVLFIQDRVGWKGRHFMTYKFRSMYTNADEITRELFKDPEIFAAYKKGNKMKVDPRLTKIGAILRKTSIDELPQLFNILKGEMSLVGPRPLPQLDVDLVYSEEAVLKKVYAAKPGLTGIWQVSGRSDLDAAFRREINCYYVHNWSIWLDIAILIKTPLAVVAGKGAY